MEYHRINGPLYFQTYVIVSSSIVSDNSVPPGIINTPCAYIMKVIHISNWGFELTDENVCVVEFVVLSNPWSNKSPYGLHSWIRAESGSLLWLSTYNNHSIRYLLLEERSYIIVPSWGLDQRFLGASLAVKGV